jgi:hypothetical protein
MSIFTTGRGFGFTKNPYIGSHSKKEHQEKKRKKKVIMMKEEN